MKPTEMLSRYVAESRFEDFPPEVILKAKYCILDSIGCALGGLQTDIGKQHARIAGILGGPAESTIIGNGMKVSMMNAAYTNAQIANVLDYDDATIPVPGHPGVSIIYPALAAGEPAKATGKELITAVILGYEIGLRVAHALRSTVMPAGSRNPQVLFNTSFKILGAAASAGRILGLDREKVMNAFGIAGGVAPGTVQNTWAPSNHDMGSVKGNYGIYAFLGTFAAIQAREGLYAHPDVLDGDEFWTKTGAATCNYTELTRGLGKDYLIMEVGFKPVPSCRGTHPQLSAVIEALKGETIDPANISEIVLYGGRMMTGTTWNNMFEAEFRTACAVSLYLSGIEPGPNWYLENRYRSQPVLDLAKKVRYFEEPKYWAFWVNHGKMAAAAEIRTRDGKVRKGSIEYPKGEPQNPLTTEEHQRKFLGNTAGTIGKDRAVKLYSALMHLEENKVSQIFELTSP